MDYPETSGNRPRRFPVGFPDFLSILFFKFFNYRKVLKPEGNRSGQFLEVSGGFPDNPSLTDHTIIFFGDIQKNILKKGQFSKCFRCSSSFQIGKQTGVKKPPK